MSTSPDQQHHEHYLPITRSNIEKLQLLTSEQDHANEDTMNMDSIDYDYKSLCGSSKKSSSDDLSSPYDEYRTRIRREGEEYRERLRRGAGPSEAKEPVWDDELEDAFQEAIRTIPLIGKHKMQLNGKRCGRNELISDYIYRTTGRIRDRKQVSSHIQVLKNIRQNDAEFIKHVSNSKPVKTRESSSESTASRKFPKVVKKTYRKNIKVEHSRSPSPFLPSTAQIFPQYAQAAQSYYSSPAPESAWQMNPTPEPRPLVYDDELPLNKWVSFPDLLYQQPTTKMSAYGFESHYPQLQQAWAPHPAPSDGMFRSAPIDPAMRTAIDPALTDAMDPTLSYLPSLYGEFPGQCGSQEQSEIETDDDGQYYPTPNYPWDTFSSHH